MTPIVRYRWPWACVSGPATALPHQRDAEFHHGARAGAIHQTPISGLTAPDTRKPNEKAPAVTPAPTQNSLMIGGKTSEKAVRR